jgi:hypothetical protein
VGADLGQAFHALLDQVYAHRYPAHPTFEVTVRLPVLRKVHAELQQALQQKDGRVFVADKGTRQLVRAIADPLGLGTMGETHLVVGQRWRNHFNQRAAASGGPMTVRRLREWMDEPRPMGLPTEVQNLIILTFAAQTNRAFELNGSAAQPSLERLPDDLELVEQALPNEADWAQALHRAGALFGLTLPETLNAGNTSALAGHLAEAARTKLPAARALRAGLERRLAAFAPGMEAPRLATVAAAEKMLAALDRASDDGRVEALAKATLPVPEAALTQTLSRIADLRSALEQADWALLEAATRLGGERTNQAKALEGKVAEALTADEHAVALAPALAAARRTAVALLAETSQPPPPPPPRKPTAQVVEEGIREGLTARQAEGVLDTIRRQLAENPRYRLQLTWTITRTGDGE